MRTWEAFLESKLNEVKIGTCPMCKAQNVELWHSLCRDCNLKMDQRQQSEPNSEPLAGLQAVKTHLDYRSFGQRAKYGHTHGG